MIVIQTLFKTQSLDLTTCQIFFYESHELVRWGQLS